MKNCTNCGAPLIDGSAFCGNCGHAVPTEATGNERTISNQSYRIGFSESIDSEPVLKALKKTKRATNITSIILVILPFLCFTAYGAFSDKMDIGKAAVTGIIISLVFALTSFLVTLKKKLTKSFEGTVIEKKKSIRVGDSETRGGKSRTKCTVRIHSDDGKKHKKEVSLTVYNYLIEGERVRFLPQFPQPFEKYDKNGETLCMFCSRKVDLSEDSCPFCHNPLIK